MSSSPDATAGVRRLLAAVAQQVHDETKRVVQRQGVTTSLAGSLAALEQPMSMRELAGRMECDPSSITYVIDKLEERGLAKRTPHPTDRRSKILVLTEAGEQMRATLLQDFDESSVLGRLSAGELTQLETLLAKLKS